MIALIDYGAGNLRSVFKALESVGAKVQITDKPEEIVAADAVILPGVGNFGDGMNNIRERGLEQPIKDAIASGKPFLGICLGMQLLLEESEEAPGVKGLGIFEGTVKHFPEGIEKVPHMGWNDITINTKHRCFDGIENGDYYYFVHSYYVDPVDPAVTLATADYIQNFTAVIGNDTVFATQYHPEKSQDKGLKILRNFVELVG